MPPSGLFERMIDEIKSGPKTARANLKGFDQRETQ